MRMRRNVVFMAAMLPTAPPTPPQREGKLGLSRFAQVRVLVRELLGSAPAAPGAHGAVVEVDHLVVERAGVLDREPRRFEARGTAERVRVTQAAVDRPGLVMRLMQR